MRFLLFVFCQLRLVIAYAQNYDTVQIRPVRVTENIFMLKGAGGNIGILTGENGTLMIDDQFAPLSNKINGAIKTLSPGDIRFLINTHLHGDHTGGNENFEKMHVTIVAHDQVRERMAAEKTDKDNKVIPARKKEALPVVTFKDKLSLHLNNEDIELIHVDRAHTDGDIGVYFKKANVFHMGDMFVTYGYPFIDFSNGGSINGFIASLDKFLVMMDANTKIIPGHGELSSKSDVQKFRDRLASIRDQVAGALKKGKKVEEIASLGITDPYDAEWGKGFLKGKDFVVMIAEDLAKGNK